MEMLVKWNLSHEYGEVKINLRTHRDTHKQHQLEAVVSVSKCCNVCACGDDDVTVQDTANALACPLEPTSEISDQKNYKHTFASNLLPTCTNFCNNLTRTHTSLPTGVTLVNCRLVARCALFLFNKLVLDETAKAQEKHKYSPVVAERITRTRRST
ncbi:hypothetical protein TRVL_01699 [Trypanosoma vivax]|nr:hypothetical protein TRVL_01699 [Trypanosoma vivax]